MFWISTSSEGTTIFKTLLTKRENETAADKMKISNNVIEGQWVSDWEPEREINSNRDSCDVFWTERFCIKWCKINMKIGNLPSQRSLGTRQAGTKSQLFPKIAMDGSTYWISLLPLIKRTADGAWLGRCYGPPWTQHGRRFYAANFRPLDNNGFVRVCWQLIEWPGLVLWVSSRHGAW